ncbi:MAG TPA: DNA mismatch repair protein MutS [Methanotrichaceae archaeon]|nr:DNA mismatch repair protein MutS [Methanotrichaceae archaeon]HQF15906.1 DNA mismatch repair protein MutS [Methanotrichaceae archaeon]HQI90746.1 DNA mismatch repair protein MutS [Methanotrichaceae archaeon]HQJ27976.1 DNA mismatch repair protein MutS [Methanotrichaceae archaeon]
MVFRRCQQMARLSPLMNQYFSAKQQNPDALLLFRMGDFYETFGDDAVLAARDLNITLTSRQKDDEGNKIPLAGIPYHALDTYLGKLVAAGHKVAICEQMEDPKAARGLVKREVIRVVTPGTVIEDCLLRDKANNYLCALCPEGGRTGLAFLDVSTGEFLATEVDEEQTASELARFDPAECLVPEGATCGWKAAHIQMLPQLAFDLDRARGLLKDQLEDLSWSEGLPLALRAAGAVLDYLHKSRLDALGHIRTIQLCTASQFMIIDEVTLRNLEILKSTRDGSRRGTLLEFLDRAQTPMGSRMIARWLQMPSLSPDTINRRLDAVWETAEAALMREELASGLQGLGDIERIMGRISLGVATPRDMAALRGALYRVPGLRESLSDARSGYLREISQRLDLQGLHDLPDLLSRSLNDEPPISAREGGIVREGYHKELDDLRALLQDGRGWISRLEVEERKRTGIRSLKIGYNNVFGYYIEVTRANLTSVPEEYERKQTLANAERFVTPALKEMEARVLSAQERSTSLEYEIFNSLRAAAAERSAEVRSLTQALGELDALLSLAQTALDGHLTRPDLNDQGAIVLRDSRHPVLERAMRGGFVPNDVRLDRESRFMILTGPNMAGKSTFMRQIALTVIMAQMGSFVPAAYASLGLVDRIFTRVGARDDLVLGQSTFMVEMSELAHILKTATSKSLILLDEIGRGTSTFDGLSIAWAVTEFIHNRIGAKTIFATHYHQITQLGCTPGVVNFNMAVQEQGSEIIFLRRVVPGATDRSYGIQVARLAGVPDQVIRRAEEVLIEIEQQAAIEVRAGQKKERLARSSRYTQLIFFDQPAAGGGLAQPPAHPLIEEIRHLELDRLTPLQALNFLSQLKARLGSSADDKEDRR